MRHEPRVTPRVESLLFGRDWSFLDNSNSRSDDADPVDVDVRAYKGFAMGRFLTWYIVGLGIVALTSVGCIQEPSLANDFLLFIDSCFFGIALLGSKAIAPSNLRALLFIRLSLESGGCAQ